MEYLTFCTLLLALFGLYLLIGTTHQTQRDVRAIKCRLEQKPDSNSGDLKPLVGQVEGIATKLEAAKDKLDDLKEK